MERNRNNRWRLITSLTLLLLLNVKASKVEAQIQPPPPPEPTSGGIITSYSSTMYSKITAQIDGLRSTEDKYPLDKAIREAYSLFRYSRVGVISLQERWIDSQSFANASLLSLDLKSGLDLGLTKIEGRGVGAIARYNMSVTHGPLRGALTELRAKLDFLMTNTQNVRADVMSNPGDHRNDLKQKLEALQRTLVDVIYGRNFGLIAEYLEIGNVRYLGLGGGVSQLFDLDLPAIDAKTKFGVLASGTVRWLDRDPSAGPSSTLQYGGSVALQWPVPPRDVLSKYSRSTGSSSNKKEHEEEIYGPNWGWRWKLGLELNGTPKPRRFGSDYAGWFVAFRPEHESEFRVFGRFAGKPNVFGVGVSRYFH